MPSESQKWPHNSLLQASASLPVQHCLLWLSTPRPETVEPFLSPPLPLPLHASFFSHSEHPGDMSLLCGVTSAPRLCPSLSAGTLFPPSFP